jgi:anaerobic dimethyl sulfoxide reductase subunit C (anchor subunit)
MKRDEPLVFFTVLGQAAAGSFILLSAVEAGLLEWAGPEVARAVSGPVFLRTLFIFGIALGASLLHLGSPQRAANALRNLRASWLSVEVLLSVLFAGLGLMAVLFRYRPVRPTLLPVSSLLGSACALGLVGAMVQVYRRPTIAAWNTPHTHLRFFVTAFWLGGLSAAFWTASLPAAAPYQAVDVATRWLAALALAAWLLGWVAARAFPQPALPGESGSVAGAFRVLLVLALTGTAVLIVPLPRQAQLGVGLLAVISAFAIELVARRRFYRLRSDRHF